MPTTRRCGAWRPDGRIGAAWPRGGEPDYHRGYGIELMSEVRFGYLGAANFRAGIADGRDQGGKTTAYVRVGRSF